MILADLRPPSPQEHVHTHTLPFSFSFLYTPALFPSPHTHAHLWPCLPCLKWTWLVLIESAVCSLFFKLKNFTCVCVSAWASECVSNQQWCAERKKIERVCLETTCFVILSWTFPNRSAGSSQGEKSRTSAPLQLLWGQQCRNEQVFCQGNPPLVLTWGQSDVSLVIASVRTAVREAVLRPVFEEVL